MGALPTQLMFIMADLLHSGHATRYTLDMACAQILVSNYINLSFYASFLFWSIKPWGHEMKSLYYWYKYNQMQ